MVEVFTHSNLGPAGIITLFVLLVFTGLLIPRWMHTQRMRDKDNQITSLRAALDKRDEQLNKLIQSSEVTVRLLEDLKKEARRKE